MTARELTKGTEIADLEARRNVDQVRAEGALLGERRAAFARFVMMMLFGIVAASRGGAFNRVQFGVGMVYGLFACATLIALSREKSANVFAARWAPVVVTLIDFAATTTLGGLDLWWTGEWSPPRHVVSSMVLMTFSVARLSVWHVAFSLALAEISMIVLSTISGDLWTNVTLFVGCGYAVLGILLALTNRAVGRMFQDLRARDNLTRFLPRQVAERVLARGPEALAPVEREVTVLFSDIRGFTSMSERMSPRDVLTFLDDYFGRMGQIVKGHDGVIGKFIGDGLLAFWGVPDRAPDHALRATRAARDMRRAVRELNQHRERNGEPPIKIGIGIHTGNVAAGMLGGQLQSEYTVIGDAVNVASRIEGLTKEHGVDVLISETTWQQLAGAVPGKRVADAPIRGRQEAVVLYALDDEG